MQWKQRNAEIIRLQIKHKGRKYQIPFPDLSVDQNVAPCSNCFADSSRKKHLPADAKQFAVGNSHKSSLMLVTDGMIANGELKWLGGKKT